MRRIATAMVLACMAAALWAGAPAHAQTPPLGVKLAACETGAAATDRFAVFSGSMPREGAAIMAMRFDLYERLPGEAWQRLDVKSWGDWIRATKRGVPGFIFTKRLERLAAPAAFRTVVTFRWSDAEGNVLRTERRTSRACHQPDWRPDLRVKRVSFADDLSVVRVTVRNRGRGAAEAFAVHVARGDLVKGRTVDGLPAREQATLSLRVGRCEPGEFLVVTLDPAEAVEEAVEDDNVTTVACPA